MSTRPYSGVSFGLPARGITAVHEATMPAREDQVRGRDGGYVFQIDDMERAKRFLILGSEASFYQSVASLTAENALTVKKLANSDRAIELIDLIVDISVNGRAAKQSPGLFALALVIGTAESDEVKTYAYHQLNKVARTASTLFEFVGYLKQFTTLGGTGFKKAIGRWYTEKDLDALAYQMVKYRQRGEFDHKRLLRLSKLVRSQKDRPELGPLLDWAVGRPIGVADLPPILEGFIDVQKAEAYDVPSFVREYGLSWEMLPTERLNDAPVWNALLDGRSLPLGALVRQLPRLTNLGIIAQLGGRTSEIVDRLVDGDAIKRARIHPLQALVAMKTYASGHGKSQTWEPVGRIVDALEEQFYAAFDTIVPTNKRHMLAIDLSASMTWNKIAGMGITPREASACMAMVQARVEPEHLITGFSGGWTASDLVPLRITARSRLTDVIDEIERQYAGGTNLSLPMEFAIAKGLPVDAFVIYTDNDLNRGRRHPFEALQAYRKVSKIDAKMITVAMEASNFTIADPRDPGMLDVAGFDTAAPAVMAEFVR